MIQSLIAYALVAAAAGAVLWKYVLRGRLQRRAKAAAAECGPDCACGD